MTPQQRLPNDDDGPHATLFVNVVLRGRLMLEAQYWDDEDSAERQAPALRRNAPTYDGSVERHGSLTLLWLSGREARSAGQATDRLL